jgi:heme-degrading monooxygenase HmoA
MVFERVEFTAAEGKEEALVAYLLSQRGFMEQYEGFRSWAIGRGVENPNKVIILAGWDSVEQHKAASSSANWGEFRAPLKDLIAGAIVEHFDMRSLA